MSIYHYSGTAKMGTHDDPFAVVDDHLRVYGVQGLRVIDASIMPTVTSGNIVAPVIMIGEFIVSQYISFNEACLTIIYSMTH